ncbi:hypothetical protein CM318V1_1490012 [Carnobacterium maltaromaticum]|nr:conserved hypothetical protein [Carnobacterium maltaromaticum]CAD5898760.1 conserved hypothetical protein [Carnobacterium maltaromaticum]CRH17258.1 hypothetical protein CM318V1_1490012 [Carnobacterium maltaromaticum]
MLNHSSFSPLIYLKLYLILILIYFIKKGQTFNNDICIFLKIKISLIHLESTSLSESG